MFTCDKSPLSRGMSITAGRISEDQFKNQMREKIVKMYTKIPFRTMGKYKMDYARITPKTEWKYNFLSEGDKNALQ